MRHRDTLTELKDLAQQAATLTAKECQSFHPERGVKCLLPTGHPEPHQWRYVAGSRSHYWTDSGRVYREPEARRMRPRAGKRRAEE